jgi:hypothetical protein
MASAVPDIVIVGPATWDLFEDGGRRPGGAVTFAARVAASMGVRAGIVTRAGPDADLEPLVGHEVNVVPSASTLTFEHRTRGDERTLRVVKGAVPVSARPSTGSGRAGGGLAADDLLPEWRGVEDIVLAPLLPGDIEVRSFLGAAGRVWILAQGLLRHLSGDGTVEEADEPLVSLKDVIGPRDGGTRSLTAPPRGVGIGEPESGCALFLSEVETARWLPGDLAAVVSGVERLVVTRGAEGASVYRGGTDFEVPACPAEPIDTTGAGDTFATAFILASSRLGLDDLEAARLASAYAAAGVERVGPAPLPPLSEIARRAAVAAGSVPA